MDELWFTGRECIQCLPGSDPPELCHLFVGYVDRRGNVCGLGPTKDEYTLFGSEDTIKNKTDAIHYAQGLNALPGIVINALGLQPELFTVVALEGTRFTTMGKTECMVPDDHVLAVNTLDPLIYKLVNLHDIGTASKHILHPTLKAAQMLYNCYEPNAERHVLSRTVAGYEESIRFTTSIGRILFRPQI